ncbi:MAG: type II toxin-antitoxin system RelE/ParE family toxin [Prosthecobacter sp.]
MIESFADKNAELIWKGEFAKKLPREIQADAREVLRILNEIKSHNDFQSMPHLRAHKLGGDRQGTWSLRITGPWRVTFLWDEARSSATVVRIEDYH